MMMGEKNAIQQEVRIKKEIIQEVEVRELHLKQLLFPCDYTACSQCFFWTIIYNQMDLQVTDLMSKAAAQRLRAPHQPLDSDGTHALLAHTLILNPPIGLDRRSFSIGSSNSTLPVVLGEMKKRLFKMRLSIGSFFSSDLRQVVPLALLY